MDHKFFIGIDLGTTNSVIAWGRQAHGENLVKPRVIETPMLTTNGTVEKKELLPSCVYFRKGDKPIVGEYARDLTGPESKRVVTAVKLEMGKKKQRRSDGKLYDPVEVSALILEQLKGGAKQMLFRNMDFPKDVVITHPASFEPNMIEATRKAAKYAGFMSPILMPEPIAVLCNFYGGFQLGEVPAERYGFTGEPKLVLVFDLGGGTLDVTLYGVYAEAVNERVLELDPIAVNRFTNIGGDNFDTSVAEFLEENYLKTLNPPQSEALKNNNHNTAFRLCAEWAKRDLSVQSDLWKRYRGEELDSEKIVAEIKFPVGDDALPMLSTNLSLSKYEECVEHYLGHDLKLEQVNQYEVPKRPKNIIEPIIDVLQEGEKELRERQEEPGPIPNIPRPFWQNGKYYRGQMEPGAILKPDVVLLNGSMTKLTTIQKRLEDFFGFPPQDPVDPDVAIALGGVACLTWDIDY